MGSKFGKEGEDTPIPPKDPLVTTVILEDGYSVVAPGDMYRMSECAPGRREPSSPGLHNLHESVIARTLDPPVDFDSHPEPRRRAMLWDHAAEATRHALRNVPAGSHINACANSGPHNTKLESQSPWTTVPGASAGLLYVATFRDRRSIHPAWRQIAVPIRPDEGRLLASVRLLPAVTGGRSDLAFTVTNLTNPTVALQNMNIVKDNPSLRYGAVANSWKPTNLGCWFHHGAMWENEYDTFRASFAWDGDLYGWDEAMLLTRKPIVVITEERPEWRSVYWYSETVLKDVTWLRGAEKDGILHGGLQETTKREDVVRWDREGIPGGRYN
ncbi:uncharacterized protein BCR38DRAFT_527769 [Pseudomassariella vexata]|uniref:Uncharacterized protein n=1 Tax=Pseudomassariella vexata TaxID=1141098 RepID=A0A1Y2DEK5_9PEZI|nr:uncharacterized protein BCR38DRAFT_527769 [Pseudomassariella vexata]ORY57723.1 hypothetical protein BCR38DRAFT_527769 [Pseudomassariella vexata]